ncbi:LLM class flavin-dependent oxidoreductase, partial [Kibdelosporangium lantanae]
MATAAEPDQSPRAPVGVLFGQEYRRRTVMMLVFQVFQTIGYYGFGTMVPLVLAAKGFAVSQSLLFTAMTFLGYPVGSAISLPLVERFERKTLVIASALGMAVFGLAFGYADSMVLVVVFGFLYTATSNVFSNGFHIYQAEIFTLPDQPVPIYVSGFGPKAARLAGRIGDGFASVMPDPDLVRTFRENGGDDRPAQGGFKVCYAPDEDDAIATAHRLWP